MNKKKILIITLVALVSFAASFAVGWFTTKSAVLQQNQQIIAAEQKLTLSKENTSTANTTSGIEKNLTQKDLQNLAFKIRMKIQEYSDKLKGLKTREQRLKTAHDLLKKDIDKLNKLRTELDMAIVSLKEQQNKLNKSRVIITKTEQENLITLAATYDKMSSDSASKILSDMTKMPTNGKNSNLDEAVKILHYMQDRSRAKVLAELSNSEPKLAALFCCKLKQITKEQ